MNNCSKHKKEVEGISDMKKLAEIIGDLHYETLTELFRRLYEKLYSDAIKDEEAGRVKLADKLKDAAFEMRKAQHFIFEALEISKPFMK
jgi:hypothetical protein